MTVRLSAVVPCFNEQDCLHELHARLSDACRAAVGEDYEIILVNDGSRDGTWAIMQQLAARDPRLSAVNLARNHGHQLALTAGLALCRGERIFIIDADLQDPPELLAAMLARMDAEEAEVVYGQRRVREGETAFKKVTANAFYRLLSRLAEVDIPRNTGDFRLMSRRALDVILAMPEQFRFVRGMVAWIGMKQVPFLYDRAPRYAGETKYPLRKMVRFAVDAITGFSTSPLRLASHAGLILAFLSIPLMIYVLSGWALGHTVPGWTSVILVVTILGASQMVMLGLLGEYIGRIYVQSKARPLFIIQDVVSHQAAPMAVPLGYLMGGAPKRPLGEDGDMAVAASRVREVA
ncbi:glycosyltransferase family 2 protein [Pedomonas mirosovicensis]|uniref:glycosyltransferase family 2 protein n=1 Tax=Pedomonas mirosovicensis TaxID=2908641 RepID=UPI002169F5FD|nr:glycosyltransferase family 2 protein [Pedomonas mirosovicensis]MCH8683771.1 glycosyltransferase family 2 protein [Pedomonas mirosovicensis]